MSKTEAENKLIQARVRMLMRHPFFGQLALRLKLVEADDWCPTAAVDGRNFYYNSEFVNKLDPDEVVFLVGHELGHCIFEHFLRREDRQPKLWNMAGDYVINYILKRERIGAVITKVQILLDNKYADWTTEDVYDDILKSGMAPKETLDVHLDLGGEGNDGKNGQGPGDKGGKGKGNPNPLSSEERKKLQDELKEAMIQAAQGAGAGNVPQEIQRMINTLTEPKMNWRQYIRTSIESNLKFDYTFMRPNRKGWHTGAILPGMNNDQMIDIALGIDTSGSIDQRMLTDFVSEVAGIMDQFGEYRIRIWQFDTNVYAFDEFTHDDGRDMRDYQITGGGGTEFTVNWQFMKDQGIEPDQFIMFTDGMPWGSWGDPEYCDTMFLIHQRFGGRDIEAPFGTTVQYEIAANQLKRAA
jgi:predicted metal-dependent peptidase|tara:strand:+ start:386 stop:1618 length:1233 start_codon:yes stop_codon:yes gene_type:complete